MLRFLSFLILVAALGVRLDAQLTISGHQPSCYGSCNGNVQIGNQGANHYHYLWNTNDTTAFVPNVCAGNYQCIILDSQYVAFDTLYITLQQPSVLIVAPMAIKNVHCYGDSTGDVTLHATGGTGTRYGFTWSTGYQGFLSDSALFSFPAGNYSLTITDANGCTADTNFIISQPQQGITITAQVTNTTACNVCNGAVVATAAGGVSATFNYRWSTGNTSAAIANICAGGYSLSVTDTSGCFAVSRINVFAAQAALTVSFSTITNIDCQHPTGFLFASVTGNNGPVHYLWNTGSTAPDVFNIPMGVYEVSATDSSGCFAVATDTIKNLGIVINTLLQQNFRCDVNPGQIIISPAQGSPPYTVHWSGGLTGDTLYGLRPGNYTVTVTDQANCTVSKTYNIIQVNHTVSVQISAVNVSCLGLNNGSASVSIAGGIAPYVYSWNTSPVQTTDTAIGLALGSYRVSVTDSFGCAITDSIIIDSNYNKVLTSITIGNCDSTGSAAASIVVGTPPYAYLWNSQPPQTTATADSLLVGIYRVSVTDSLGCIRTGSANVRYSCTGYVTGTVFYDANANCNMDNGEQGVAGVPVLVTNSNFTFYGTTNLSGQYTIPVTEAGTYAVITGVNSSSTILQYGAGGCGYLEYCPVTDTVTFVTLNHTFQNHNFGFVGSSDYDLSIQAGWTPMDANRQKEYWILYANQAFLTPYTDSATITFNYDANLTFQSGIPAPVNNVANHTLTWVVDSLPSPSYIWADRLRAFFTVSSGIAADYQLKNDFDIEPLTRDCDTINNSIYTEEIPGLPVVPISKEVSPQGNIMVTDSVLTYTIHFQNTGNDSVHVVKVTDSLSFYLDPQSVVTIASSPLFNQFYIAPGAVLTWVFNSALPASSSNAIASAGFVSFTAKLKPIAHAGDTIHNKAQVYFDNASAIVTNTTNSFISYPVAITELTDAPISVSVFPNPFNNSANVMVKGLNGKYDFELIDLTGRVVKSITSISTSMFQLNRDELTAGVYIYSIYSNNKPLAYGKLIIE